MRLLFISPSVFPALAAVAVSATAAATAPTTINLKFGLVTILFPQWLNTIRQAGYARDATDMNVSSAAGTQAEVDLWISDCVPTASTGSVPIAEELNDI
jgi:hypothetical protein